MTANGKDRSRWHGAAPRALLHNSLHYAIKIFLKKAVVYFALRGWLSARASGWLIWKGGLRHV
ncbi:MAG: hypothetical protein LBI68_10795 [Azoarcus sp.]|jgi:hypothetical protein|nr:hypothetical protein [Azoarcus sp.]